MILDLCLLKGGVPMDVISEIIAYEKHAEEIVAQANKKAELQPSAALSLSVLTMNSRRTGINGQTRYIKISFRLNDSIA